MLKNKKILFIAPNFFEYSNIINERLLLYNAAVDFYYDKPQCIIIKLMLEIPILHNIIMLKHYKIISNKLKCDYDYVFIIKGSNIPESFYKEIKSRYKNAIFIQYHWDDIDLYPELINTFKYFDNIFTYNIKDSKKYKFNLRPFFYDELNEITIPSTKKYDLFFIGSYSKTRFNFVKLFFEANKSNKLKYIKHFYINIFTFIKDNINHRDFTYFKYHKLSYKNMLNFLINSKATLDIPYEPQQGLTTRTFEAIFTKTKIVTTNKNVKHYDFYNINNFYIIDKNNPKIDINWINTPFEDYNKEIYDKYSLERWISDVFDIETK